MLCLHSYPIRVCYVFVYSCVCLCSQFDRPTVVKFTGHLDRCSLLLMVLFRKLQCCGGERVRTRQKESERKSQKMTTAASITLSTSILHHFCAGRQMFFTWVCTCMCVCWTSVWSATTLSHTASRGLLVFLIDCTYYTLSYLKLLKYWEITDDGLHLQWAICTFIFLNAGRCAFW